MSEWGFDKIKKVYIDSRVQDSEIARRVPQFFTNAEIQIVDSEPLKEKRGEMSAAEFDRSKTELFITRFDGAFFKRCPGARPGLTCCNYFVLNLGSQCNMNCSYCYLQSFLNSRVMKIFVNIEDALKELTLLGEDFRDSKLRIGTGEVIDSLSFDPFTQFSKRLIEYFRDYPAWRLEFKTKSSQVDQFLDVAHAGNVIVSFSVNPQNIIEREEHGTASMLDRLDAAVKARDKGFLISFHIDPMIWHPEWKNSYQSLVAAITARFSPNDIPIMSVGALRFQPEQRHLMRDRFGMKSLVTSAETFPGYDGKYRYDQSIREEMFQYILGEFKKHNSAWNIFMCMETPETWMKTTGGFPTQNQNLKETFDHRLIRRVEDRQKVIETQLGN